MAKWIVHFECPVCGEGSSSPLDKCPFCKSELSSDMVSDKALKQVMWERDIARGQLAEIGKGLGAKMDDVRPVVHGRWIDERWRRNPFGSAIPYSCDATCSACGNHGDVRIKRGDEEWEINSLRCPVCGAFMDDKTAIS